METIGRPQSSSFWGFIFRILYGNPKKELLWGLWVKAGFRENFCFPKIPKDAIIRYSVLG